LIDPPGARLYLRPVRGDPRQIVAFGGGGFSMERGNTLLDDCVLRLARERSSGKRPKVCFLPTASGDADHYIVRFYRAFSPELCEPSHVSLFRRECAVEDVREHLLTRDLIYVGGGSVISLLGAWQAHGIDVILREAWECGVVLCGLSAGSLCWFAEAVTAFHGPPQPVKGLGLLPWSNCVHFGAEPERCVGYRQMLVEGMRPGYAAEDGAALHFEGERLARVVASRAGARAHRMRWTGKRVSRRPLASFYLGGEPGAAPVKAPAGRLSVVAA
jgi:dipeptidase E